MSPVDSFGGNVASNEVFANAGSVRSPTLKPLFRPVPITTPMEMQGTTSSTPAHRSQSAKTNVNFERLLERHAVARADVAINTKIAYDKLLVDYDYYVREGIKNQPSALTSGDEANSLKHFPLPPCYQLSN